MIVSGTEPLSKEARFTNAFLSPFIILGMAFLWNVWGRFLIGWPEITTMQQLVVTFILF